MRTRILLRAIAVLIAVAATVDPAWPVDRPQPARLVAIDLADGDVEATVSTLRSALGDWHVERREASGGSIPCAPGERCVVIADGSVDAALPADLDRAPSLIAVRRDQSPNVALVSATAPAAHLSAAGTIRVQMRRSGPVGETALVVRDGSAVVGSITHAWTDAVATVDIPWWPIDATGRALRIEATPIDGEANTIDNVIDIGVPVQSSRVPVLVFDARPSWSSTFVRRALEDDPRLTVEHRARIAPALSAGTRSGILDVATLERTSVAVVGEPNALTGPDVALLERFVRVRGGSLILLPERRITGPAARLLAGEWTEHLSAEPERVGALQASEVMRATGLPVTAVVLARSAAEPSVVSLPLGHGRVIVSGAMDAWRYRSASFDDFWRSTAVEAGRAGDALRFEFGETLASTGQRVPFVVRHRSFDERTAVEIKVTARCDGAPSPVRVWPSGRVDTFTGELAFAGADCELRAQAADRIAVAQVAGGARPARGVDNTLAKLERAITAHGGTVKTAGDESSLARELVTSFTPTSQIVSIPPMRSLWWMLPFAGCLAVEWWLRRREGLR